MSANITPRLKVKDPAAVLVYGVNWGNELAAAAGIATSTWTIVELAPVAAWSASTAYVVGNKVLVGGVIYICILAHTNFTPPNAVYWTVVVTDTPLTKDNESIVAGLRSTQVRLSGGRAGQKYQVTNRIVTNETPTQTEERTFDILAQDT